MTLLQESHLCGEKGGKKCKPLNLTKEATIGAKENREQWRE